MSAALHPYAAVMVAKAAFSMIHEALCMNHIERTGSFTCQEAEATHAAYLALGLDEMAEQFMAAHAYADDLIEGDIHVHIDGGVDAEDSWRYATEEEKEQADPDDNVDDGSVHDED